MNICSDNHSEIIHSDGCCPLCALCRDKDDEIKALEKKIEEQDERVNALLLEQERLETTVGEQGFTIECLNSKIQTLS